MALGRVNTTVMTCVRVPGDGRVCSPQIDGTIAWHTRFVEHGGGTHAAGGLPMDTVATTILWHLYIPRSIHSLVRENWLSRRTYVFYQHVAHRSWGLH